MRVGLIIVLVGMVVGITMGDSCMETLECVRCTQQVPKCTFYDLGGSSICSKSFEGEYLEKVRDVAHCSGETGDAGSSVNMTKTGFFTRTMDEVEQTSTTAKPIQTSTARTIRTTKKTIASSSTARTFRTTTKPFQSTSSTTQELKSNSPFPNRSIENGTAMQSSSTLSNGEKNATKTSEDAKPGIMHAHLKVSDSELFVNSTLLEIKRRLVLTDCQRLYLLRQARNLKRFGKLSGGLNIWNCVKILS